MNNQPPASGVLDQINLRIKALEHDGQVLRANLTAMHRALTAMHARLDILERTVATQLSRLDVDENALAGLLRVVHGPPPGEQLGEDAAERAGPVNLDAAAQQQAPAGPPKPKLVTP